MIFFPWIQIYHSNDYKWGIILIFIMISKFLRQDTQKIKNKNPYLYHKIITLTVDNSIDTKHQTQFACKYYLHGLLRKQIISEDVLDSGTNTYLVYQSRTYFMHDIPSITWYGFVSNNSL